MHDDADRVGLAGGVGDDVLDDIGEVDRCVLDDLVLGAGQQQQTRDEPFVPGVDLEQVGAELQEVVGGRRLAVHRHLDHRAAQRQRRTQLV